MDLDREKHRFINLFLIFFAIYVVFLFFMPFGTTHAWFISSTTVTTPILEIGNVMPEDELNTADSLTTNANAEDYESTGQQGNDSLPFVNEDDTDETETEDIPETPPEGEAPSEDTADEVTKDEVEVIQQDSSSIIYVPEEV